MIQPEDQPALQTDIVHPHDHSPPGFEAFPVPVARASTVVFPDLATMRGFDLHNDDQWRYGLHQTPTSKALMQRLGRIEGARHVLLQPSGLAAISNVYFGLLRAGDDVLVPDNAYSPNREHGDWLSADFGITVRYYDPMIDAANGAMAALIRPNTRLVWVEAPGSVTMEVPDVPGIAAAAHAAGALVAIDNTFSAGLAFKPFQHGCDISVQALTKYHSGGSDVLMGATYTNDADIHTRLKRARMRLGLGVSADDCSLVLRSLPSLALRYGAHGQTALALATWLKSRPEIAAVLHPALPDCPGHANWLRDFEPGAGGLFSVVFVDRVPLAAIDAFIEGLRLFKIGFSWGGAHSLAVPYRVSAMRTASAWPHRGGLVRFYIGLEEEIDLRHDLQRALDQYIGA